ncbi:MAG: acyltransferase family protein, partial [Acidimicrobiia bacterium]
MSSPSIAAVPAVTERNRYVDFLRVASIAVVVLGHWLMAVIAWEGGRIVGGHLLAEAPRLQLLTWVFQVMPVFFIVGGYANAASWSSAERRGVGYGAWMRARAARLLRPTAVFVAVWTALALVVRLAPIDPELVQAGSRLVAVPLWFLAVYFFVIPAVPVMLTAHGRFGVWVPVVLTAAAAAVDLASWGFELPLVGWANFALVWLAVHQLGFLWRDGMLTERGQIPWLLAGGGLAALALLVWLGPYPLSMVGVE